MKPVNQRPNGASVWLPTALTVLGLGVSAWGLALHQSVTGFLGLGMILTGWIGLYATFAAAKTREARLAEMNRALDEQVQARTLRLMQTIGDLESFNRMVTHDLSSPLTAMIATLETLDGTSAPDLTRSRLDILAGCVARMRSLIEGLQELALISGRLPTVKEVDVSQYADLVFRHLQVKDPDRDVRWTVDPGLAVFGDPNLIHIALENLLGNAWKYTVSRTPSRIHVRRGKGPGRTIEIQDNGIGFDMAKADALFQPFKRLHADPMIPGHGIGLSIVKRVMEKHAGRVSAESLLGQGAIFRLEFPDRLEADAREGRP